MLEVLYKLKRIDKNQYQTYFNLDNFGTWEENSKNSTGVESVSHH